PPHCLCQRAARRRGEAEADHSRRPRHVVEDGCDAVTVHVDKGLRRVVPEDSYACVSIAVTVHLVGGYEAVLGPGRRPVIEQHGTTDYLIHAVTVDVTQFDVDEAQLLHLAGLAGRRTHRDGTQLRAEGREVVAWLGVVE